MAKANKTEKDKVDRVYIGIPCLYYERSGDISIFNLFGWKIYKRIGNHISYFGL